MITGDLNYVVEPFSSGDQGESTTTCKVTWLKARPDTTAVFTRNYLQWDVNTILPFQMNWFCDEAGAFYMCQYIYPNIWDSHKPVEGLVLTEMEHPVPVPETFFQIARDGTWKLNAEIELEEEKIKTLQQEQLEIMKEVSRWATASCSQSVKAFRSDWARANIFPKLGYEICQCGIKVAIRKSRKRNSLNHGQEYYGCADYPNGCSTFQWVSDDSFQRQKLSQTVKYATGWQQRAAVKKLMKLTR